MVREVAAAGVRSDADRHPGSESPPTTAGRSPNGPGHRVVARDTGGPTPDPRPATHVRPQGDHSPTRSGTAGGTTPGGDTGAGRPPAAAPAAARPPAADDSGRRRQTPQRPTPQRTGRRTPAATRGGRPAAARRRHQPGADRRGRALRASTGGGDGTGPRNGSRLVRPPRTSGRGGAGRAGRRDGRSAGGHPASPAGRPSARPPAVRVPATAVGDAGAAPRRRVDVRRVVGGRGRARRRRRPAHAAGPRRPAPTVRPSSTRASHRAGGQAPPGRRPHGDGPRRRRGVGSRRSVAGAGGPAAERGSRWCCSWRWRSSRSSSRSASSASSPGSPCCSA